MIPANIFYMDDSSQTGLIAYRVAAGEDVAYGVADDVESARMQAREALADLAPSAVGVPPVEFVERQIPLGFLVRLKVSDTKDAAERDEAAHIFATTVEHTNNREPIDLSAWGESSYGVPLVVVCMPYDTVGDVLVQLDANESCIITMGFSDKSRNLQASWVSGIVRGQPDQPPQRNMETLADAGLDLDSTINDFMRSDGHTRASILAGGAKGVTSERVLLVA